MECKVGFGGKHGKPRAHQNITRMECKAIWDKIGDNLGNDQNITRMECKVFKNEYICKGNEILEYNQNGM